MAKVIVETDAQVDARIAERFDVLRILTEACIDGVCRSLILSGPPGLGKTFTIEKTLKSWDDSGTLFHCSSGYLKATGLFKLLYQYRHKECVLVLDDTDSVFQDEVSLNLLKKSCDSTETRRLNWGSDYDLGATEDGEDIPNSFNFEGSVIFVTNLDFDALIAKNHKYAPHLQALISRSHYIDLSLRTKRDYLMRIVQVVKQGLLDHLTVSQRVEVVQFIEQNQDSLRELSLRMCIKIGHLVKAGGDWKKIARITCLKN